MQRDSIGCMCASWLAALRSVVELPRPGTVTVCAPHCGRQRVCMHWPVAASLFSLFKKHCLQVHVILSVARTILPACCCGCGLWAGEGLAVSSPLPPPGIVEVIHVCTFAPKLLCSALSNLPMATSSRICQADLFRLVSKLGCAEYAGAPLRCITAACSPSAAPSGPKVVSARATPASCSTPARSPATAARRSITRQPATWLQWATRQPLDTWQHTSPAGATPSRLACSCMRVQKQGKAARRLMQPAAKQQRDKPRATSRRQRTKKRVKGTRQAMTMKRRLNHHLPRHRLPLLLLPLPLPLPPLLLPLPHHPHLPLLPHRLPHRPRHPQAGKAS